MNDTMIGVDLAKNVFVLHGASMNGRGEVPQKAVPVAVSEVYSGSSTCGRGDGSLRQRALLGATDAWSSAMR